MKTTKQLFIISLISLFVTACASNPPAPVVDRAPSTKTTQTSRPAPPTRTKQHTDHRHAVKNSHVVKKGDTLFSLGLQYGYDYKDIAAANNIQPPYAIQIGQTLKLPRPSNITHATDITNKNGVVITPIKTEPIAVGKSATVKPPKVTPVYSEPTAKRVPYSVAEMNKKETKVLVAKQPVIVPKPTTPTATKTKTIDPNAVGWHWPTKGKVVSLFKEVSNKGIDIAGKKGQAINAAGKGKVIYTGSDLRGYGKLVIVKHNKTYLSVYAHNSKILVKEGQWVGVNSKIAEMGNSDSNSVKLHFEIRRQGKSVDPMQYLPQN